MLFLSVLILLAAQLRPPAPDDLIVPGVRVGPITRTSTEASLLRAYGKSAVRQDIDIGEGMTEPGLVIYPDDPTRRLAVLWNDEKPAHPASIYICYSAADPPCRWHTADAITLGVTLKQLERLNHKSFEMVVWGSDVGGNVVSYQGGALEGSRLGLTLYPRINKEGAYVPELTDVEFEAVQGEKIVASNHPVLQKLNPYVVVMTMTFAPPK